MDVGTDIFVLATYVLCGVGWISFGFLPVCALKGSYSAVHRLI